MPRRTGSTSSRDEVLAAATRVLRERGLQGFRVREVASAASMSPSAVMYHYPSTEDLLLAVHEHIQASYLMLRRQAIVDAAGNAWEQLMASFKVGLPPYGDSQVLEVLMSMHTLARRSPRHAVLLTDLWDAEYSMYVDVIKQGTADGTFTTSDPKASARALLALEDGLALHIVSANTAITGSAAVSIFSDSAAAMLGVGEVAHGMPK